MEMLGHYAMTGNLTNKNAGYSMWGFATRDGKDYFVKQFLAPKYPLNDTVSSPERLRRKKAECDKFTAKKTVIYQAINSNSDGNDVRICEFFRVGSKFYISMEKINALPWEIETIAALSEEEKRMLCAIIAHGIAALHTGGVVHADLKHENILYTRTPTGSVTAKIIDFDSAFLETVPPADDEEVVGDWVYFPPEIWSRMAGLPMGLTCKIDVFALGVLFHQYFSGKLPEFDPEKFTSAGQAALAGEPLGISEAIPEDIAELLRAMLQCQPADRPTAQEVFLRLRPALPEVDADGDISRSEELEEESIREEVPTAPEKPPEAEETKPMRAPGDYFFVPPDLASAPRPRAMFCPDCGAKLDHIGRFCPNCGSNRIGTLR